MVADPVYTNSTSWLGVAIESTIGTPPASPTYWIPVKSPKIVPVITEAEDDALRGSMVKVYGQIPTVRHDEYTFTCLHYADTVPMLFRSLLGSADAISGTNPYTHQMSVLNSSPLTANQGPTYTFYDYDGYKVRQLSAAQVDEITVKMTATGMVEYSVKVLSNPYVAINIGAITTAFTAIEAAPAWNTALTLNSLSNTRLVEAEIMLKRGSKIIPAMGLQAPYKIQTGPLDLDARLSIYNATDAEQNLYLNNTTFNCNLVLTPPANSTFTTTYQMSTCKAKSSSQERGSDELIVTTLEVNPLPNATDVASGAGGVSPFLAKFINAQAATF